METMTPIEETEEVPVEPRRRGTAIVAAVLLVAVIGVGGFLLGLRIQKHKDDSAISAVQASAGTRANQGGATGGTGGTQGAPGSTAGQNRRGNGQGGPGNQGAVSGQVKSIDGTTLLVTDNQGNTVKVTTTPQTQVLKTTAGSSQDVNPDSQVQIFGQRNDDGSIEATEITLGGTPARLGRPGGTGGPGAPTSSTR